MNTPAHLIFGLAAFGDPMRKSVTAAALAGAMIPDLSLYLMAGTHLYVMDTPPRVVFGELYFSDAWQAIFRVDNSIILWGLVLVIALMAGSRIVTALAGAALLHLGLDFLLHHDDGRAHFWPITNWIFQSPVSYWDSNHYGNIVGPIEALSALVACVWLWRRFHGRWIRALIVALGVMECLPIVIFSIMFAGQ